MKKYILHVKYKCETQRRLRSVKQKQLKDFLKLLNSLEKRKSNTKKKTSIHFTSTFKISTQLVIVRRQITTYILTLMTIMKF